MAVEGELTALAHRHGKKELEGRRGVGQMLPWSRYPYYEVNTGITLYYQYSINLNHYFTTASTLPARRVIRARVVTVQLEGW